MAAWDDLLTKDLASRAVSYFQQQKSAVAKTTQADSTAAGVPWCFADPSRASVKSEDLTPAALRGRDWSCTSQPAVTRKLSESLPVSIALQLRRNMAVGVKGFPNVTDRDPMASQGELLMAQIADRLASVTGLPQVYLAPAQIVE